MSYLKSSQIKAYPVVNRNIDVSGDLYSRHTSEESITSIVNKLINSDGFVITRKADFGVEGKPFEFNIHGYYFKVMPTSDDSAVKVILDLINKDYYTTENPMPEGTVIYAAIKLTTRGTATNGWVEIDGYDKSTSSGNDGTPDDSTYYYTSVYFTNAKPATSEFPYSIPLFQYVGPDSLFKWAEDCYVKNEYYLKFFSDSFEVDGGDLDI